MRKIIISLIDEIVRPVRIAVVEDGEIIIQQFRKNLPTSVQDSVKELARHYKVCSEDVEDRTHRYWHYGMQVG